MNNPRTVIAFIDGAHFIGHRAMMVFATAVLMMGPVFTMAHGGLLPYATPASSPSAPAFCSPPGMSPSGMSPSGMSPSGMSPPGAI